MKRTPEVMDVWLDSGTMPFSQYHWPFENAEKFEKQFPADFICEAVDQTRGWFYTLSAVSTIIKNHTPYKNVISVGHVLDEKGKKMSKSLGNIVVPNEAFSKFGADVVRYYFYCVNQPGEPKLFSEKEVTSISRNLFLTLWNVFSFFSTYASIDNFVPTSSAISNQNDSSAGDKPHFISENILDKWILAKYQKLTNEVVESLDKYDPYKASNLIVDFVGELSTWYVRRSRRRFWKSENDNDKLSAYETLYYVLMGSIRLLAPFTPMFSEFIYGYLKQENDPESIHLTEYPKVQEFDHLVLDDMETSRKIVEAGLSQRAEAKIKVRQPLSSLTYFGKKLKTELENIIIEEVNVKKVEFSQEKSDKKIMLDLEITPELKIEGAARDLIRNIQSLRKKSNFQVEDRIYVYYQTDSQFVLEMFKKMSSTIGKEVLASKIENTSADVEGEEEFSINDNKVWIGISRIKK